MVSHPRSEFYLVDVCSGYGGLGLAIHAALDGHVRTVLYCERDAYAASVLVARMEDKALDSAPIWDDVKSLGSAEVLEYLGRFDAVRTIVCAGYPCQPFSCAGKRAGADDPRHLWPWIAGFVKELRPGIVFFENVPGHLRNGFAGVYGDLRGMGYRVEAGLFSAEEVGASHRRERLFVLGCLADAGCGREERVAVADACAVAGAVEVSGGFVANATRTRCDATGKWPATVKQSRERLSISECDQLDDSAGGGCARGGLSVRPGGQDEAAAGVAGSGEGVVDAGRGFVQQPGRGAEGRGGLDASGGELANSSGTGLSECEPGDASSGSASKFRGAHLFAPGPRLSSAWQETLEAEPEYAPAVEPAVYRMADGSVFRVDTERLRCVGNGVVPLAAAYAFVALAARFG